ncbi:hypothetical protein ACQR0Z_25640 [Bradyrhizobium sp. HKCCYLS3077]|uniref:hypothetical protein n=1 Tax=Bradyrhizobium sp. HKCCYLS3077 TaxID=3420761 RepID=UPI003EBC0FF2
MTFHRKSEGPAAVDAARGADGRLAHAPSRAGSDLSKKSLVEHHQKLFATFAPCREAHEQQRSRDAALLRAARAVAEELEFKEESPGYFSAMCPECDAIVSFGCDAIVTDNPPSSCKAVPSIRERVQRVLKAVGGPR